jgi:hypothetical protein
MMVGIAHLKLVKETGARPAIIYLSILSVVVTLIVFTVETLSKEKATAIALVIFVVAAILVDRYWRSVPYLTRVEADEPDSSGLSQGQAASVAIPSDGEPGM